MGDLNVSTKGAVTTCDGSVGVGGCKGGRGAGEVVRGVSTKGAVATSDASAGAAGCMGGGGGSDCIH